MNQKKRKTQKKSDMTPKAYKSISPPLLNIIKLPTLPKVSSPQMSHRFFPKAEESKKAYLTDRKPTKSLYSFSFSNLADSLAIKKKSIDDSNKIQVEIGIKSEEQSLESQPGVGLSNNFSVIEETLEENTREKHSNSISVKDIDSNLLLVPIELERKSRQKTIKAEKAVETCTLMGDEIEYLKKVLRIEQENYRELMIRYNEVVDSLNGAKGHLSSLQAKSSEYENLKKLYNGLKTNFDDCVLKHQNDSLKAQKKINEFKEDVALKNSEIEHLNVLLNKSDIHKNRYAESLSHLESELQELKKENSTYRSMLESSRNEITSYNSRLIQEKNKVESLETMGKQMETLKSNNYDLQERVTELEKENLILTSDNNEIRKVFNTSKTLWREKKKKLKSLISSLSSKAESESLSIKNKISEAFKPKRSTTLRDYDDKEFFTKENILILQKKLLELEVDLNDTKIERDKLKSSVDYCKDIIETKSAVVRILEEQVRSIPVPEGIKKGLRDSGVVIKNIGHCMTEIRKNCKCQICEQAGEFLMLQCEHIVCSTCQNFQERCPICASSGRLFSIPSLRKIVEFVNKVNGYVEVLEELIVKYS